MMSSRGYGQSTRTHLCVQWESSRSSEMTVSFLHQSKIRWWPLPWGSPDYQLLLQGSTEVRWHAEIAWMRDMFMKWPQLGILCTYVKAVCNFHAAESYHHRSGLKRSLHHRQATPTSGNTTSTFGFNWCSSCMFVHSITSFLFPMFTSQEEAASIPCPLHYDYCFRAHD